MNPVITTHHVSRRNPNSALDLAAQRRREAEEKQRAAHQAALHVIDVMDAIRNPMPTPTSPRTDTPPAATGVERTGAERNQRPPGLHAVAQGAQPYLTAMALACAFLAGIALGKAL